MCSLPTDTRARRDRFPTGRIRRSSTHPADGCRDAQKTTPRRSGARRLRETAEALLQERAPLEAREVEVDGMYRNQFCALGYVVR